MIKKVTEGVTAQEIKLQLVIANKLAPDIHNITDRIDYANLGGESAPILNDEEIMTFLQLSIGYQELARAMMNVRWKRQVESRASTKKPNNKQASDGV